MGFSITFTNYSPTEWTRSVAGSTVDAVLQNLNKSPGPTLKARSGVEAYAASQSALAFVATGAMDLYCCWYEQSSKQRFGVRLWYPFQMFDIGKAPYWYVMADRGHSISSAPDWILAGSDPSQPYTWGHLDGFAVRATPTASHTSLDVQVIIEKA